MKMKHFLAKNKLEKVSVLIVSQSFLQSFLVVLFSNEMKFVRRGLLLSANANRHGLKISRLIFFSWALIIYSTL